MREPAITIEDAYTYVGRLESCLGYPKSESGVQGLAEVLRACALTDEHAKATIRECLDLSQYCPTPYDLRNIAYSIRDRYREPEPPEPIPTEEEADPQWSREFLEQIDSPAACVALRHEAIRDALDRDRASLPFWEEHYPLEVEALRSHRDPPATQSREERDKHMFNRIRAYLRVRDFRRVSQLDIARAKATLGYPLTIRERELFEAAPPVQPKQPPRAITQADIERAREKKEGAS